MGTRHLIVAIADGNPKIAQYGQWDGYPSGQGATVTKFIVDADMEAFKAKVLELQEETEEEWRKQWAEFGVDVTQPDTSVNMDVYDQFSEKYPQFSRDTGAGILDLVANGKATRVKSDIEFAADSLFCEWAYVLDLDKGILEVYEGFNKKPLTEGDRFYYLMDRADHGYTPVKKVWEKSFDEIKRLGYDAIMAEFGKIEKDEEEEDEEETVEENQ